MENNKAEWINLPKIFDPRGSLTVAEEMKNIPFAFKQTSWRYGMALDQTVKGETKEKGNKLIVALAGSFRITLLEGDCEMLLNHPYQGLWIKPNTPYTIHDFSYGAVCLEISSDD